MIMKKYLLLSLFSLFSVLSYAENIESISIMQMIISPEKYTNKKIDFSGFATIGFEKNVIYFHKDDADFGIIENALWLIVDPKNMEDYKKYSGKYVRIIGTFKADEKGHLDMFTGSVVVEKIKLAK